MQEISKKKEVTVKKETHKRKEQVPEKGQTSRRVHCQCHQMQSDRDNHEQKSKYFLLINLSMPFKSPLFLLRFFVLFSQKSIASSKQKVKPDKAKISKLLAVFSQQVKHPKTSSEGQLMT